MSAEGVENSDPAAPARSIDPFKLVAAIGSPIALGSALLLYFGWVRSHAQARSFGADVSVFGMSPQELVLRSVNVLFFPIILLLLGWLLLVFLRPRLHSAGSRLGPILRWSWLLVPIGLVLRAILGTGADTIFPLWVLLAVGGTWYSGVLRRAADPGAAPAPLSVSLLVGALVVVALFWQTERLARLGGEASAAEIKANLHERLHPVTVFSATRIPFSVLEQDGAAVQETELEAGPEQIVYRYDGLWFLQQSGGKFFLLTDGWDDGRGRLLVLHDTESVRLEFGSN